MFVFLREVCFKGAMSVAYKISDLCLHNELKPLLASWIYNQFWTEVEGVTESLLAERFSEAVTTDSIPLALIAFDGDKPVGTVSLIESDDDERPHLSPWLAALYVHPQHRNKGAGAILVKELLKRASNMGVSEVFLGTERPDFYQRLGATIIEKASANFYILKFTVK